MVDLVFVKSADIASDNSDVASNTNVTGPTDPGEYTVLAVVGRATRTVVGTLAPPTLQAGNSGPAISGIPAPGQTLTGVDGAFTGADSVSRQWVRITFDTETNSEVITDISAATALTYVGQDADKLLIVALKNVAQNAAGSTTVYSNRLTFSAPSQPSAMLSGTAVSATEISAALPASDPSTVSSITSRRARLLLRSEYLAGNFANASIKSAVALGSTQNWTGLTGGSEYAIQWAATNANGESAWSEAIFVTASTVAVVTAGTPVAGSTTVSIPWSTTKGEGTGKVWITASPTQTAAEIEAATTFTNSIAVTAIGAQSNFAVTGLNALTSYYAHIKHTTPAGDSIVRSVPFSTQPAASTVKTAEWGADTPAQQGGFRPLDAQGNPIALTGYASLVSGSLGSYTPSVVSGRLVFNAAGAPNGAVLRCNYAGGTVDIQISTVANCSHCATLAEANARATFYKATPSGTFIVALRHGTYTLGSSDLGGVVMNSTTINGIDHADRKTPSNPVFDAGSLTFRGGLGETATLDGTLSTNGSRGVKYGSGLLFMTQNTVEAFHYEPELACAISAITKGTTTTVTFASGPYNFNQIVVGDLMQLDNMPGDFSDMNGQPYAVTATNVGTNSVTLNVNSSAFADWKNPIPTAKNITAITKGAATTIVFETGGYTFADISVGDRVTIAGLTSPWSGLNGLRTITAVNAGANSITVDFDSASLANWTSGGTVTGHAGTLRGYVVPAGNAQNWNFNGSSNLVLFHGCEIDNSKKNPNLAWAPNGFNAGGGIDQLAVIGCRCHGFYNFALQLGYGHKFVMEENLVTGFYQDVFACRTTRVVDANLSKFPARSVVSITQANPPVVTTSTAHGLETGDTVVFTGTGNSAIEYAPDPGQSNSLRRALFAVVLSPTTFSLQERHATTNSAKQNVNGTSWPAYSSGGTVYCNVYSSITIRRNAGFHADLRQLKAKHTDFIQGSSSLNRLNVRWKLQDNFCNIAVNNPIGTQAILGKGGASDPVYYEGPIEGNILVSGAINAIISGLSRAGKTRIAHNLHIRDASEFFSSKSILQLIGGAQDTIANIVGNLAAASVTPSTDTNLYLAHNDTSPNYDDLCAGSFVVDGDGVYRCAALRGMTGTYAQRVNTLKALLHVNPAYNTKGPWADPDGPLYEGGGGGGGSTFTPNLISGNGAYFQLPVAAVADGTLFTLAMVIKTGATVTGTHYLWGGGRCFVRFTAGKVHVQLKDTTNVTLADVTTTANIPANSTFGLFVQGNTGASPSVTIAINAVAQSVGTPTVAPTAGTMDINQGTEVEFLASSSGASPFTLAAWGAIFFDTTTTGLVAKDFWDTTASAPKTPVGVGAPKVLITDNAAGITASVNEAPGGSAMTIIGALLDA